MAIVVVVVAECVSVVCVMLVELVVIVIARRRANLEPVVVVESKSSPRPGSDPHPIQI